MILTAKKLLLCIKNAYSFSTISNACNIFFLQKGVFRAAHPHTPFLGRCPPPGSLSVCLVMHFLMLQGIELKVGMGVGDGLTRFVGIFSKRPHLGSKVIQGSICLRNVIWPPNLVSRTPDQSVVLCWGQRPCRGQLWSFGVKLLRNALWPPNLVGRIPDQSVMYCWGQRSCRGQLWSFGVSLLCNALWPPNLVGRTPDQRVMHYWGQRSCRGHWGSICFAMPYGHQIWWEEPLTKA